MRQYIDTLVPIYTGVIQTDDDKQTVGSAVECIAELGKLFGPPALEKRTFFLSFFFLLIF